MMASKAMEQQFQDEIDEAPYVARLRAVMGSHCRFPGPGISQVLDHLYLGSAGNAENMEMLKEAGITHVINCAAGYTSTGKDYYFNKGIKYIEFDAEDDDDYNMIQHFQKAYDFIEKARTSGGKVLVHCIMGINRSGLLVTAYCMLTKKMGPISSAKFVKKAREMVLSNEGFQRQLVTLARERDLLHLDRNEL